MRVARQAGPASLYRRIETAESQLPRLGDGCPGKFRALVPLCGMRRELVRRKLARRVPEGDLFVVPFEFHGALSCVSYVEPVDRSDPPGLEVCVGA